MHKILDRLSIRSEPVLYVDGKRVLDPRGLRLLSILDNVNSLLEASKSLGIPYSRVWEYIAKLERALKIDIIHVKRGGRGGGLELTPEGQEIVRYIKNNVRGSFKPLADFYDVDIHIAGSDDMLLGSVIGSIRKKSGLNILYSRIGSLRGLSSLLLGDSHIAPIHLMDPNTGEYNVPYVRRLGLEGYVYLLYGYQREVGFIFRKNMIVESIEDLIQNQYRVVNRCRGSGIRILFDNMIRNYAEKEGINIREITTNIPGYNDEVDTHKEAVSRIVDGTADVTLGLRIDALSHGLEFKPLKWEQFDFIVFRAITESNVWGSFYNQFLDLVQEGISTLEGYRLSKKFGKMIEP